MRMAIVSGTLMVFFTVWYLLSVLQQFLLLMPSDKTANVRSRVFASLRRWDGLRVLPYWTLFSTVYDHDLRLLYRDRLYDGQLTPWKALDGECHQVLKCIWNPDRRRKKAIIDICAHVVNLLQRETTIPINSLVRSGSYLSLAGYVSGVPHWPLSESTQFIIARTFSHDEPKPPEILFVSPVFRL
jgi:hypothetical protein